MFEHNQIAKEPSGVARVVLWKDSSWGFPRAEEIFERESFFDFQRPLELLSSAHWAVGLNAEYHDGFFVLSESFQSHFGPA
ncbi:MAG: hypothetical protein EA369_00820 [Bradymonadales bacterium]|nr:MAG: hypothetical protein EA369_00820 [Bradymonadales bacterium]